VSDFSVFLQSRQEQERAVKLEQMRQDFRDGLNSGDPTPWNPEEIKRGDRKRISARVKASYEA
jgi:antitoxin ParD1/3/4